jgi:two-component system, OmpR family, sensor histidine kinase MprB
MSAREPSFWWHYRRSLASRVTLLTSFAVGLSILVIALGAYVVIRHQLQANTDQSLVRRADAIVSNQNVVGKLGQGMVLQPWVLGMADVQVALIDPDRTRHIPEVDSTDFPVVGNPEYAVAEGQHRSSVRTITAGNGTDYRVAAVEVPGGGALVLAQSLAPQESMFTRLGIVMLCFGVAGAIGAGFLGWAVATGGLRPVRRLTEDVERIGRTEDLAPLAVTGTDEIARLTTAFNEMLAALAASRDRQRQLVADAGHELRTPLTSLRTNIDLLTQADASITGTQRAELLGDVRAQIEELTTLIGDLVELARDEPALPVVEAVELPEVVDHALERVRRRAPSVTWQITTEPWWVIGESGAIERAVTNLLDNAGKWSPSGGTVRVSLVQGTLTVDDEGPGIAEADLPHVFDRFYRSTESRSMPGSGLGLAIVRQTAERAGGSVVAGPSPYGGARLVLRLPGSTRPVPRMTPTGARSS